MRSSIFLCFGVSLTFSIGVGVPVVKEVRVLLLVFFTLGTDAKLHNFAGTSKGAPAELCLFNVL